MLQSGLSTLTQETKHLSVLDKHSASAVTCMPPMSYKVIFVVVVVVFIFSHIMTNKGHYN